MSTAATAVTLPPAGGPSPTSPASKPAPSGPATLRSGATTAASSSTLRATPKPSPVTSPSTYRSSTLAALPPPNGTALRATASLSSTTSTNPNQSLAIPGTASRPRRSRMGGATSPHLRPFLIRGRGFLSTTNLSSSLQIF